MKLGSKILLTIATTFLCLTAVLFLISQTLFLGSFKKLEQDEAKEDIKRVFSALNEVIAGMSSLDLDWASWDDTYFFVKDLNKAYIESNLNNETLAKQRLSLIIYLDEKGRTVYSKALNPYTVKEVQLPADLTPHLSPGGLLSTHNNLNSMVEGIIPLKEGFLMVTSRPILTSRGEGPIRGSLIMGRYLDGKEVGNLSQTTHMPVRLVTLDEFSGGFGGKRAGPEMEQPNGILLRAGDAIEGYGLISDIYGKPAFLLRVDLPRDIFQRGKAAVFYFIIYLVGAAFVSAASILAVLKKGFISRLSNLGATVSRIGTTGSLSERVPVRGRDELSHLSGEINRMLASLESLEAERKTAEDTIRKANDELETRVRERTTELIEINMELKEEIAERKRVENAMKEMIYHDYLTGLPNRMLFTDRLNQVIARRSGQRGNVAAVIYFNIDRFKFINDSLGHAAGDELIKTIAKTLEGGLREGDTIARIGGDEFTILVPDLIRPDSIPSVVERIVAALKDPVTVRGHQVFVTPSIGIAVYPYDGADSAALLKNAAVAMYHAKTRGGNSCEMYNPEMAKKALEHLTISNRLRTAVDSGEFVLYYQPQYDLKTGMITGAEALIRWQDPEKGLITPASFIPIAEETGVIVAIGDWVLRTACELNKKIQGSGLPEMVISINISARMLSEPDFSDKIRRTLDETGMDPRTLELEITESLLMANLVEAASIIKDLERSGIRFSIDDFGTGYSSLAYLKNLSIAELKIDRSFIKDLTVDTDDRLIVTAIINLAHNMGLEVIAEGVETSEQLDFLKKRGCDRIQGFLFSKPLPEREFMDLLQKQP